MDLQLEKFEGPLDLLLHLIKTNKIDIYDIPISELTEQYIDYLKKMESLNMDIASEFIVMASELLYIKSKMLLPNEKKEEEDAEDPRAALVEKLLDYKKYAEISSYLKEREHIGFNSHTKHREKIKGLIKYNKINMEKERLPETLEMLYRKLSERALPSKEAFSEITEREIVSVSSMEDKLKAVLKNGDKLELVAVFSSICKTRAQLAAAFSALLSMIKDGDILLEAASGKFYLLKGENND